MLRVLLAQCGGPTTVFNASLAGALGALRAAGAETWGVPAGARGLAEGRRFPIAGPVPVWLAAAPGAALGAGRGQIDAAGLVRVVADLRAHGFEGCLLSGGNGTMALGAALGAAAQAAGYPLRIVGVPKTIDNDMEGTDHTPGFPSAASFVAGAVRDLADDLQSMAGFEDVRLIEVMGRRAGWLAASAIAARRHPGDAPHFVLLPEEPLDPEAFIAEVRHRRAAEGPILGVVAEGACGLDGVPLGQQSLDGRGQGQVLGGAAANLAALLRDRLGLRVRAESLGFLPRCLRTAQTARDRQEASLLGAAAADALLAGRDGVMAGLAPGGGVQEVPLREVGGRERRIPAEMRDLGPRFEAWLRPLLDLPPAWPPAQLIQP